MAGREVDVGDLFGVFADGAFVLDVRQPDEYEEVRVPGAFLIPLGELPERVEEVPDGVLLHVICRSGARSGKAVEWLCTQGFEAVNVAGGTLAWVDAGYPVDRGSGT